jgi:hypothetical protein
MIAKLKDIFNQHTILSPADLYRIVGPNGNVSKLNMPVAVSPLQPISRFSHKIFYLL